MVPSKKKCVSDACRKNRNLALRSGSLFISTQKVHKPKSQSQLHFEVRKFWQIRSSKYFPIAWHWLPADMLERWLHVCRSRVKITFTIPLKNRFIFTTTNSMKAPCKLDSTESLGSFEKYPSPPQTLAFFSCVFDVIFVTCESILTV